MRRLGAAVVVVGLLAACSSGGSSSGSTTTTTGAAALRSDLVPRAVAAVEAQRGGAQQYTEINAFDRGVNVFVATGDGNELPYVYRDDGALEPPAAPQAATATPFPTAGVALDAGPRLVREVTERLPEVRPVAIALVQRPVDGLVWDVTVIGSKGGQIDVLYTPAGVMLGVVTAS